MQLMNELRLLYAFAEQGWGHFITSPNSSQSKKPQKKDKHIRGR
jgi:hypothetical protein